MRSIGLILIFLLLSLPANALAEKRVALVIGNSAYQHVPQLANPRNDAADMAAKLEGLGFDVVSGEDLDFASMRNAAREFTKKLEGADLSLFFYAGHGLQVNGSNFMAPVDAQLASYNDLDYETLPMDLIVTAMERNTKVNLVFLDACRDNPLAENLARSMGTRSGSVGRGLSKLGTGVGSLIAFATQPGNVALDGEGRNSPFTTALLKHLGTPGQSVTDDLILVRKEVLDATQGKQVPWDNSSLTGPVVLKEMSAEQAAAGSNAPLALQQPATYGNDVELAYWESVKDSTNPRLLETYLEQYPQGAFAKLAIVKIEVLKTDAEAAAKTGAEQGDAVAKPVETASLSQPDEGDAETRSGDPGELALETQQELARLGCLTGKADGKWGAGSERALNNYAGRRGIKLPSLQPTPEVLSGLKAMTARVCPLVCGKGMEARNGRCVALKREARTEPKAEPRKLAAKPKAQPETTKKPEQKRTASGTDCYQCLRYKGMPIQICLPAGSGLGHPKLRGLERCKKL